MGGAMALAMLLGGCTLPQSGLGGPSGRDAGADAGRRDAARPDADRLDAGDDAGAADAGELDADPGDAGPGDAGPRDFYDLTWGRPEPVPETVDTTSCETDPIVTSDLRWLLVTRPAFGSECFTDRRFHVFEWNDGRPVHRGVIPPFEPTAVGNAHPLDGRLGGGLGEVLLYYTVYDVTGLASEVHQLFLSGSPPVGVATTPMAVGPLSSIQNEGDPTLDLEGSILVFHREADLYEARGMPPATYGSPLRLDVLSTIEAEYDPALSADGRVLVFTRQQPFGGDFDLWVARRREPTGEFESPEHLPRGPGEINTDREEFDCFLTAAGDLLFTTSRDDPYVRRIYMARAM